MTSGRLLLLLAVAAVTLAHARAAPLDADSCTKLEVERALLRLAGVEWDMQKGPDWAKTNLAPERLGQIRRLIEVEEQLLFRCRETPDVKGGAAAAAKKDTKRRKSAVARPARKAASSRRKEGRAPAKARPAAKRAAK